MATPNNTSRTGSTSAATTPPALNSSQTNGSGVVRLSGCAI
jgi:hypothetical protein